MVHLFAPVCTRLSHCPAIHEGHALRMATPILSSPCPTALLPHRQDIRADSTRAVRRAIEDRGFEYTRSARTAASGGSPRLPARGAGKSSQSSDSHKEWARFRGPVIVRAARLDVDGPAGRAGNSVGPANLCEPTLGGRVAGRRGRRAVGLVRSPDAGGEHTRRFNEATAVRPWKPATMPPDFRHIERLQ